MHRKARTQHSGCRFSWFEPNQFSSTQSWIRCSLDHGAAIMRNATNAGGESSIMTYTTLMDSRELFSRDDIP